MSADEEKNPSFRNGGMDEGSDRGGRDYGGDRGGFKGGRGAGGKGFFRKKVCKFCTQNLTVDYKNPDTLRRFVTERGKILPRRITGTCAKHQRALALEIKRSRVLALMPFVKK
jgi:small subunit ribosomal protein S18